MRRVELLGKLLPMGERRTGVIFVVAHSWRVKSGCAADANTVRRRNGQNARKIPIVPRVRLGDRVRSARLRVIEADLRLEQPRSFARRAPAWFGQSHLVEDEAAVFAARGKYGDAMALSRRRTQRVAEIFFRIAAAESHLARDRRHRARLVREQSDQLSSSRHF